MRLLSCQFRLFVNLMNKIMSLSRQVVFVSVGDILSKIGHDNVIPSLESHWTRIKELGFFVFRPPENLHLTRFPFHDFLKFFTLIRETIDTDV